MRKGETITISVLLGVIITIVMLAAVGTVIYKNAEKSYVAREDFADLVALIESMEDDTDNLTLQRISSSQAIVTFEPYELAKGGRCFEYSRPDTCPLDEPCICFCEWGFVGKNSDACTEGMCFVPDLDYSPLFYAEDCSVVIEGTSSGIYELYLQRKGDNILFCESEPCVPEYDKDVNTQFLAFMDTYKTCVETGGDNCTCDFSNEKISPGYYIRFLDSKAYLIDKSTGYTIDRYDLPQQPYLVGTNQDYREEIYLIYLTDYPGYLEEPVQRLSLVNEKVVDDEPPGEGPPSEIESFMAEFIYLNNGNVYFSEEDLFDQYYSDKRSCLVPEIVVKDEQENGLTESLI